MTATICGPNRVAFNVYFTASTPERLQLTTNLLTVGLLLRLKGLGGSMERRYLVAALAIIATFAVTSRGFRTLERMSLRHDNHFWTKARVGAMAKAECEASSTARAMTKLRTRLRPRYPEEAQLLAEMNVPIAAMQSRIAQQMARQDAAISQCARERAMQDAERARRDAMRLQERMTHAAGQANMAPISLQLNLPSDLDQRIQAQTAALAARFAANNVKLQVAADRLRESSVRIDGLDLPAIDMTDDGGHVSTHVHVHTHANCKASRTTPDQRQPE